MVDQEQLLKLNFNKPPVQPPTAPFTISDETSDQPSSVPSPEVTNLQQEEDDDDKPSLDQPRTYSETLEKELLTKIVMGIEQEGVKVDEFETSPEILQIGAQGPIEEEEESDEDTIEVFFPVHKFKERRFSRKSTDEYAEHTKRLSGAPTSVPLHRYSRTLAELHEPNFIVEIRKKRSKQEAVEAKGREEQESRKEERRLKYQDDVRDFGDKSVSFQSLAEATDLKVKLKKTLSAKGMRLEYGRCPHECQKFMNIEDYAEIFVDDVATEAIIKEKYVRKQSLAKVAEGITYSPSESSTASLLSLASISTYVCVLEWPTIEEFDIDLGVTKIEEYVSYWKFEEDWKYCIHFLKGVSDAACDFYRYEAIFSIPSKQYPIPQGTASVYFTFELSRVRPKTCLVDMYYTFEGQRLVHKPGKYTFQEGRLFHIIDAKLRFYKTLKF